MQEVAKGEILGWYSGESLGAWAGICHWQKGVGDLCSDGKILESWWWLESSKSFGLIKGCRVVSKLWWGYFKLFILTQTKLLRLS